MFQVLACHFELILGLLIIPKCIFVEVEKAMFQVVARHWELIFFLLSSPKCDLGEVEFFDIIQVVF